MIEKNTIGYSLLKLYMKSFFRLAFDKIEYVGKENIPQDGAIILAPNHTNAFMEPLALLTTIKGPIVFVARADIFKNKTAAKVLNFLKIMPIMRQRDGRDNLKKNEEVIRKSVYVLRAKIPFCIMAEGTHRPQHSLLPLVKGIFRIAIQANNEFNGKIPVYIVPIGVEYGDFFRFRSTLLVNIGKPVNITEIEKNNKETEQVELIMQMRDELYNKMKAQIHYVPYNEDYEALLDISYICNETIRDKYLNKDNSLLCKTLANQYVIKILNNSNNTNELLDNAREFARLRRDKNIADEDLYSNTSYLSVIVNILTMIVSLPYFIYSVIVNSPIIIASELINKKTEDRAFHNSMRLFFLLLFMPIILTVLAIFLFPIIEWYYLVGLLILTIPSYSFAHYYTKIIRLTKSHITILKNSKLKTLKKNILKNFLILNI